MLKVFPHHGYPAHADSPQQRTVSFCAPGPCCNKTVPDWVCGSRPAVGRYGAALSDQLMRIVLSLLDIRRVAEQYVRAFAACMTC
jgi:hypothetical protein